MGNVKFQKPVVPSEPLKVPRMVLEFPKSSLEAPAVETGMSSSPGIPREPMKIIPDLGQNPGVQYSADMALVRVNPEDFPLQKYETSLSAARQTLNGITESLVVYLEPGKFVSGAKKGALSFLGADLLVKIFYGEFLTGTDALGVLSYFVLIGAYIGWGLGKVKTPPPLPEARLLESGKKAR